MSYFVYNYYLLLLSIFFVHGYEMLADELLFFELFFFFFKQKTAYEMRISDWSSDVCSSDLLLAIVAADAEILVDEEDVGRLADAVLDEEVGDRGIHVDHALETILLGLDEAGQRLARGHVGLGLHLELRLPGEQSSEGVAVELDDFRLDRGANGRSAAAAVDQRHLADIGARREIGEEDGLSTDRLLHHHRALADDIDVIAFFALGDDRLAGANALDLGGLQYFGKIVGHKPRAEHLEKLPLGRNAGDRTLGCRHGRHQFQRGRPRNLDEDGVLGGPYGGAAAASGNEAHFAEDRAGADGNGDRRVLRIDFDQHRAVRDGEE